MTHKCQTRPVGGRVRCDFLGRPSHRTLTPFEWRAQLIASRYQLAPSIAREVSSLHFGETIND